ncbi:RB40C protein, partial [Polypterus senegalus]
MADSEKNRVAIVVEELQALDKQIQKLLSRRRYLRDLKTRLLDKPHQTTEAGVTSTPPRAAQVQGQVSFAPAPRRNNADEDLDGFQLCRRGFKARTPPAAQASIQIQNRFDPLRVPSLPSTPGDIIVMRVKMGTQGSPVKSYDYLLKFLLVGDSDVGKGEILDSLQDGSAESPYAYSSGIDYKTTTILLDGRRVKLELWDTSGQGRFCTIFRSYSRGAQGILLVYDITNRWSFDGIDRWIREIDEHAPGVPRILVGNRLHLAFKRQVPTEQARAYAEKNGMTFFEVSPLCNFNVIESFTELSRIVLMRHGMEKFWRPNRVFSLQDLCCRAIVSCTPVHLIDKLPLPVAIKSHLKSFSMANGMNAVMMHGRSYSLANAGGSGSKGNSLKRSKSIRPPQSPPQNCTRNNCKIS